jgi:hypothetical protein
MVTTAIRSYGIFAITLLLGLTGCVGANEKEKSQGIRPAVAKLTVADDCGDLLDKIQDDVIAKIDLYTQELRSPSQYTYSTAPTGATGMVAIATATPGSATPIRTSTGGSMASGAWQGAGGTTGSTKIGTATAPSNNLNGASEADSFGDESASTPSSFSSTTKQVEAVDEADIVKTDGTHLYILHGDNLVILTAWEPASLKQDSEIKIEGSPTEMFVHQGKAVVFSTVYDNSGLIRGVTAQGEKSGAAGAGGWYGNTYGVAPDYYGYGTAFTKITVVTVKPGAQPAAIRELYIEGSYLSARLYADKNNADRSVVRAIVTGGFKAPELYNAEIDYVDPWGKPYPQEEIDAQVEAWRTRIVNDIRETELSDWLPIEREKVNGDYQDVPWLCQHSYIPSPGLTDYGVTNIVAFDLSDEAGTALGGASVLGSAAEVYSNEKTLVLAHTDWSWQRRAAFVSGETVQGEQTALHRFELEGITTQYVASGFVPGLIIDQFSLDESDGIIRVATTENIWARVVSNTATSGEKNIVDPTTAVRQGPDNRVITLKAEKDLLAQAGISPQLGEPGERIMSTRFIGDTAYVVTFRKKDPLIVLDLKDPAKIAVLGEVTIPGFSDYIHPIDSGHLLTIGRDTDVNGWETGLLLQIFDVTDRAHPTQAFKYAYTREGYSEANQNQKAFTYYAEKKLLAFPFASYNYPMLSTLELFRVDTASGFEPLGSIDHTDLFAANANCKQSMEMYRYYDSSMCGWPSLEVRRGVFISGKAGDDESDSDYVYSISYAGVKVNRISDLTKSIAQVQLPMIQSNGYYGGDWVGSGGMWGVTPTGIGGAIIIGVGGAGGAGGFGGAGGADESDAGREEGAASGASGMGGFAGGYAGQSGEAADAGAPDDQ